MKVIAQILFVLFYVASAYAVRSERVADTLREIRNSVQKSDTVQISSDERHSQHGFPRYREAKKANKDFENRPIYVVDLAPVSTFQEFTTDGASIRPLQALDISHPRAPPIFS